MSEHDVTRITPKAMRTFCLVAIGLGTTVGSVEGIYGQSAHCETLEAAWAKADGFAPSQVTDEARKLKAKQIDQFGDSAKGLGAPAMPWLQPRLGNERRDPFFLFDASPLLSHLDSSPASHEAVSDEALDEYASWSLTILDKINRNNFCDDLRSH
jgi:hypothetical protein